VRKVQKLSSNDVLNQVLNHVTKGLGHS